MVGPVASGSMVGGLREAVDDATRRARRAVAALGVCAASGLLTTFAFERFAGCGYQPGEDLADAVTPVVVFGGMSTLISVATVVLFLLWLHRAVANARLMGRSTTCSPAEAVGAYFIPVLNFFRPYQAMKELHRASDPTTLGDAPVFRDRDDADYRGGAREVIAPARWAYAAPILGWWLLFALRPVVSTVALPLTGGSAARVVGSVWDIAAAMACVLVIRSVDSRQRERCRRLEAMQRSS